MKQICTCACHTPGNRIMHMQACCNKGYIDVPDLDAKEYVKDGDWFEFYYEEFGYMTEQHNELFNGKIEINPDWEIKETQIGTVYVLKPKKKEDGE